MSEVNRAILTTLITMARDLHEPGEGGGDYTRGQVDLIADACGLPSEMAHNMLTPMLYADPPLEVSGIVNRLIAEADADSGIQDDRMGAGPLRESACAAYSHGEITQADLDDRLRRIKFIERQGR